MACWEQRGCDDEMQAECPHHSVFEDQCPAKCAFAWCDRPNHAVTADPDLMFSAEIDRSAAIKESCITCEFFLVNGPKLAKTTDER
jgi:hypothetical protein